MASDSWLVARKMGNKPNLASTRWVEAVASGEWSVARKCKANPICSFLAQKCGLGPRAKPIGGLRAPWPVIRGSWLGKCKANPIGPDSGRIREIRSTKLEMRNKPNWSWISRNPGQWLVASGQWLERDENGKQSQFWGGWVGIKGPCAGLPGRGVGLRIGGTRMWTRID